MSIKADKLISIPTKLTLYTEFADNKDAITDADADGMVDGNLNKYSYSPASTNDICTCCGRKMEKWDNAMIELGDNNHYYCFDCILFTKPPLDIWVVAHKMIWSNPIAGTFTQLSDAEYLLKKLREEKMDSPRMIKAQVKFGSYMYSK